MNSFYNLAKDDRIIVYGGVTGYGENHYPVTNDSLLVLDTTVNPFTWSIPDIQNPPSAPSTGHTATLVGNYMIIAFGIVEIFTLKIIHYILYILYL